MVACVLDALLKTRWDSNMTITASRETRAVLNKNEILPSLDECEAVVSLGGPMNVYETDKYPFLDVEEDFLKKTLKKEIPVLGICLGAQLLAKAAGAEVRKAKHKEIGWCKIDLTEEGMRSPLFNGLNRNLEVFQWHEDTFDIPGRGVRLAESQACINQAFRFGRNAYGLQFHVEVTPQMIGSWINKYIKNDSRESDFKDLLIESHKRKESFRRQADMLYFNFAGIMAGAQKIGVD